MKAVAIKAFGGPQGLSVIELPDPEPAAGQVLIATEAIGVGGVDVMIRSGAYAEYGFRPGHVPGGEIAGVVSAVGADVDEAWIGRRVWAFAGLGGGYAEQAVAPATSLVPLPAGFSAADAVTVGSSGVVARFGLEHAHFVSGESVLVRGAAGGIGVMALQLAALGGAAAVAVTSSSAARGRRLLDLGATHVLDRSGRGDGHAPSGYDVVIDVVAGPGLSAFYDMLEPNGRMVAVGAVGGRPPADLGARMFAAFRKSLSFATFSADTVPVPARNRAVADLFAAVGSGRITSVVHRVLPLEQAESAHRMMDDGEVFGRIVLAPSRPAAGTEDAGD